MRKGLGRHNRRSAGGPQPSLVLDFAGTGTLDSRVTFTRSTTATYYNSSGVLSTAAINAPRFDYNPSTLAPLGLLIEQSSTNLNLYSQDFTNGTWVKYLSSVTGAATTAPDGTTTGQKLIANAVTNSHHIYQINVSANTQYTFSIYAKISDYTNLQIFNDTSNVLNATFNLSAVTTVAVIGCTSSITSVGNGWYRCSVTHTTPAVNGRFCVQGFPTGATASNFGNSFLGDGASGIFIWASQLEALAFPTSYIPTTTAQVTRAADNASMTGTNFSSWYNATQGTLFAEYNKGNNGLSVYIAQLYTASSAQGVSLWVNTNGIDTRAWLGATNAVLGNGTLNAFNKAVLSYTSTSITGSLNGAAVATASGTLPSGINALQIGVDSTPTTKLVGWVKKIVYYPTNLTNAQLQALTT